MHEITIISELDKNLQVWTFFIEEADLIALMEKYGASGTSVLSDTENIAAEISDIYK